MSSCPPSPAAYTSALLSSAPLPDIPPLHTHTIPLCNPSYSPVNIPVRTTIRPISTISSHYTRRAPYHLLPVPLSSTPPHPISDGERAFGTTINLAVLNVRSLLNKSFIINDMVLDKNLDVLLLTETWHTMFWLKVEPPNPMLSSVYC